MVPFVKMHGNGNDFIVLDNRGAVFSSGELSALAIRACRRRQSLGADGILVLETSSLADYRMRLFNADGSEGEMCGNGARCIARYAFEKGISGQSQSFETLAGIMKARVDSSFVTLHMGRVDLVQGWLNRILSIGGRGTPSSFLVVGVPHAVLFPEGELAREEMILYGRELRNNRELFPAGANVNFVVPEGEGRIRCVTYERGVEDLTDSCGTGSTAAAAAWVLRNGAIPASAVVDVVNPGGVNTVSLLFDGKGASALASLRGRTVIVAEGRLTDEAEPAAMV